MVQSSQRAAANAAGFRPHGYGRPVGSFHFYLAHSDSIPNPNPRRDSSRSLTFHSPTHHTSDNVRYVPLKTLPIIQTYLHINSQSNTNQLLFISNSHEYPVKSLQKVRNHQEIREKFGGNEKGADPLLVRILTTPLHKPLTCCFLWVYGLHTFGVRLVFGFNFCVAAQVVWGVLHNRLCVLWLCCGVCVVDMS